MNIKRFTLLALSISVLSVGAFVGFKKDNVAKYSPRAIDMLDNKARSYHGSLEHIRSIRANMKTGRVDYADIAKAKKQIAKNKLSSNKTMNINWQFKGPDNVGGRTRAFVIDQNNQNTIYAGSVSGGLFVSNNQGNSWQSYSDDLESFAISTLAQTINGDIYFGTGPIFDNAVSGGNVNDKDNGSVFVGNGIYKLLGNGQVEKIVGPNLTSTVLAPNVEWSMINKIAVDPFDPGVLYVAMNQGVRVSHDGGATWFYDSANLPANKYADDIEVGSNGTIIATYSNPGEVYKSEDKGVTFRKINNIPFATATNPSGGSISRVEYTIAPSDPNVHYASVAYNAPNARGNCLYGVFQTIDDGETFTRIIHPAVDNYDFFFNNGQRCQGQYDNTIAVFPNNPYKILMGGITLYRWEQTAFPPQQPNGALIEIGNIFDFPGNDTYVHADKHNIVFKDDNTVYVTTDGGISKSTTINLNDPADIKFTTLNLNYNVTQYYAMGVGPTGLMIGGTQDNGTNVIGYDFNQGQSGVPVIGGDGFDCDMSNLNPSIAFGSLYYGQIRKITGLGNTLGSSNVNVASLYSSDPDLSGRCAFDQECGPFYTVQRLWESFYDTNSKDSVNAVFTVNRSEPLPMGSTIKYESITNDLPLHYTTDRVFTGPIGIDSIVERQTSNGIVRDTFPLDTTYTVKVKDYVQAILAVGNLKRNTNQNITTVHITRDAVNASQIIDWIEVAGSASPDNSSEAIRGAIKCIEFSKDGNHIFVGTNESNGGGLYRISNIKNVHTDADGIAAGNNRKAVTRKIGSFNMGSVVGIAVDPNDANRLVAAIGNYGHSSYVFRTSIGLTAMDEAQTFQQIMGSGATALPNAPAYDAMIDYKDSNVVLIGNDFGVYGTENAFDPDPTAVQWTAENIGLPEVGVYEIRQQTFGIDDSSKGITNTGEVYLATHARGMYQTRDLVGLRDFFDKDDKKEDEFKSSLKIYPNPAVNHSNFTFILPESQVVSVKIYDLKGKLIRNQDYNRLAAGEHRIRIDANNLTTGTYILQLIAGNKSTTGKFIIQK